MSATQTQTKRKRVHRIQRGCGRSRLSKSWRRFYIQLHAPVATEMRFMSHDKLGLWQLGITHVLNAAHGKLCCKGSDDFYGTTVKYYGVPANDLPTFDLSPFFYPAAEFIHQALTSGGKVFVHCAVGVSRSAALVLAYLMIHHHLSLLSSVRCVQEKRWIFPNRGFLRQLIALDRKLQDEGSIEAK
ncbi:dual specificity protein phosphatase 13-like isoform X2 [Morone saxatilis]|uniref:dual specificity protein phosphatase 13-like isoform X2 n=1 Tax=Morone saxatilis TaxID=34816 RepID=UPI0015E2269B|nr:dual specificity protein phosphatase 13-like isoform X2 [Morone saxatilis]